jgi:titin
MSACLIAVPLTALAASPAVAASVPGAPTAVSGAPGNAAATVVWKAPANTGGSPITSYVVTPYLGTTALSARAFPAGHTRALFTGLKNGKTYRFTVAARNAVGTGASSTKSGLVTAGAPGRPGKNGQTRIQVNGSQLPGQIQVVANPPQNNGSVITKYTAACTSSDGGVAGGGVRKQPAVYIVLVSDLTKGKTYRCTMTATNARGTGPRSMASNALVIP